MQKLLVILLDEEKIPPRTEYLYIKLAEAERDMKTKRDAFWRAYDAQMKERV